MLFDASDTTDDSLTAPFRTVPDSGLKLSFGVGGFRWVAPHFIQQTQGGKDM